MKDEPGRDSDEAQRREPVDLQQLLVDVSRLAASRRDLDGLLGELVVVLQKAVRFDGLAAVLHDPVCDMLGLEPEYLRAGLDRLKEGERSITASAPTRAIPVQPGSVADRTFVTKQRSVWSFW